MTKNNEHFKDIALRSRTYIGRLFYVSEAKNINSTTIGRLQMISKHLIGVTVVVGLSYLIYQADMPHPDKIILIAGLLAMLIRLVSGLYFAVALILLIYIPILQINGHIDASNSFAVYAFYFLCFGTASAVLQLPKGEEED
ncbi:MAG: hypothetical protein NVS1B10_00270 [Candidatus Saccharimonadales bacterium]